MTQNLPGMGAISYNGYSFLGPRAQTSLRVTPVYDSTGRTVKYNIFQIEVRFTLTSDSLGVGGGAATDGNMVALLSSLNQAGGALVFEGLGYGPYLINTGANPTDVIFGPKPQVVSAVPLGSNLAMRITWTCEVHLVACGLTGGIEGFVGQLLELAYVSAWTSDQMGLMILGIRGHSEIALNRTTPGANTIAYSADQNWPNIAPTAPLGFRQKNVSRTLSEDKAREDFDVTFEEIAGDNALPPYVSDLRVDQAVVSALTPGGHQIPYVSVTGFVETVKPNSIALGLQRVLVVINERLSAARANGRKTFITSLRIIEPLFNSRRVAFDLQYFVTPATDNGKAVNAAQSGLLYMIPNTGMFNPVGSTDWASWQYSMTQTAWSPYGFYGQGFNPGSDLIVDHCNQQIPNISPPSGIPTGNIAQVDPGAPQNDPSIQMYVYYNGEVRIRTYKNAFLHYPLQTSPPAQTGGSQGQQQYTNQQATYIPQIDTTQPQAIPQIMGQKPVTIVLTGSALRVNAPVELPTVSNAFGTSPDYNSDESEIVHTPMPEYFGATLYAAAWHIVYNVSASPQNIANLMTGDLSQLSLGTASDS